MLLFCTASRSFGAGRSPRSSAGDLPTLPASPSAPSSRAQFLPIRLATCTPALVGEGRPSELEWCPGEPQKSKAAETVAVKSKSQPESGGDKGRWLPSAG